MRAIADDIDSKWCPRIDSDKQEPFGSLVRYLQLEEYMGLKASMKAAVADFPNLVSASQRVLVSQDQHTATILPEGECFYNSVASVSYKHQFAISSAKCMCLRNGCFLGLVKAQTWRIQCPGHNATLTGGAITASL